MMKCMKFLSGLLSAATLLFTFSLTVSCNKPDAPGGADAGKMYRVEDFGAVGDGKTDDTPAIRKALAVASRKRHAVLVFGKDKVYHLGETRDDWFHFRLEQVQGLTIEGNGATLLSDPTNQILHITRCRDIRVSNIKIDYSPLPFTQGTISAISRGSFTFTPEEGYPANLLDYWYTKEQDRFHGWSHCITMEPDMKNRNENTVSDHLYIGNVEKAGGNAYRITVLDRYIDKMGGMREGDGMVIGLGYLFDRSMEEVKAARGINFGHQSCFYIHKSSKIEIDGISILCCPGRWYRITDNLGEIKISNSKMAPPEGTDRCVATILDGIHSKNNRGPVIIDGNLFQATMDDLINCCQMEEFVKAVHSPTEIQLVNTDHMYTLYSMDAGNELQFVHLTKGKILGTAKIKRIISTEGRSNVVELDRPVQGLVGVNDKNSPDAIFAMNYGRASSGFRISRNTFIPILRRAVAVQWCDGEISDNVIDCHGGGSIWMTNNSGNHEGPFIRNVKVTGNRIINSFHPSIYLGASWKNAHPEQFDCQMQISGNVIENQGGGKPAIKIVNMKNLVLKDNSITMGNSSAEPMEITNCSDIRKK